MKVYSFRSLGAGDLRARLASCDVSFLGLQVALFSSCLHVAFALYVAIVQSLSCACLFVTPRTAALQASVSFTISQSWLKLMFIGLMMPSHQLILCCPLLLLPSVFPSIRIISNELALHIKGPEYWSLLCMSVS